MSEHRGRRAGRRLSIVLAVAAAAAVGAALASAGGTSRTAPKLTVAKARADVAAARRPLTAFSGPTTSPGPVPAGKKIVSIFSIAAPLPQRCARGVAAAAKAAGWSAEVADGKGNPSSWVNAIDTAVTGGANAVVMCAAVPPLLAPGIAKAKDAGAPFAAVFGCAPSPAGTFQVIDPREREEGYRLGEWVVQDSPNGASVLAYDSPEFPCLKQTTIGFKQALADAGPRYKIVDLTLSPASDITSPSQGSQRISALLRKHPEAKYFFLMSESWAGVFAQALKSTGRTDVTGLGTDSDFFLGAIRQGAPFVSVAPDTLSLGWYAVDALIRAFNGKPPVQYRIPYQLVDRTNAKQTKGDAIANAFDYRAAWLKLWGLRG